MKTMEKDVFELPVARMAVTRIMRASAAMPAPRITKANWVGSILMQERGVNVKNLNLCCYSQETEKHQFGDGADLYGEAGTGNKNEIRLSSGKLIY